MTVRAVTCEMPKGVTGHSSEQNCMEQVVIPAHHEWGATVVSLVRSFNMADNSLEMALMGCPRRAKRSFRIANGGRKPWRSRTSSRIGELVCLFV